jgi:HK97 family phage major capsid protein
MSTLTKEEIAEVVKSEIENHAALKAFSDAHKQEVLSKGAAADKDAEAREVVGNFLKSLGEGDQAVLRDLSEGVAADGGYVVPNEFYRTLIEKKYKYAQIRQYATVVPMTSDKLEMPVEANTVSVNWTTELATITQSDPTFALVTLAVNMLAGISRQSRQLLQDSAINESIQDYIIRIFARALALTEDTAFMVGSGTGQPKGIRTYTISQSVAQAGANLADSDITNLEYALPRQYRVNAAFIMHDSRKKLISNLRSTDGKKLHPEIDNKDNPTLNGYPVIIQDDIPTNLGAGTNESEIYFGDVSYYYIGDREQMFAEVSTQEGTSFEKHRAAVKVGERLDGQLSLTEAFAKLTAVK